MAKLKIATFTFISSLRALEKALPLPMKINELISRNLSYVFYGILLVDNTDS